LLERYHTRTGVTVTLRHEGVERRFPAPVEIAAYRIVQEALTNIARYASSAPAIVQLLADEVALTIVIRDTGPGFDLAALIPGSGLGGMRERAELLGGALTVDSRPGEGVAITAEIPLGDPGQMPLTEDGAA
jgi:signal transduction histidine kinase